MTTRIVVLAALMLLVAACASGAPDDDELQSQAAATALHVAEEPSGPTPSPRLELALDPADLALAPLPLRAGAPFTITTRIHNRSDILAVDVPVVVHLAALQDEFGYQPFLHVLTVTVPPSASVPITVPVHWNLASGEHRLWMQTNRLPDAWQAALPLQAEANLSDNTMLVDLWVEPFDAQVSTLCAGRVDLEIEPADILPEPDAGRVLVTIHNLGNRAVYNVPVVVFSTRASGIAYSPAIPPCGGTMRVSVDLEGGLAPGDTLNVQINPAGWTSGIEEDNYDNNHVAVSAGFAPGAAPPLPQQPADYDFWVDTGGIELAQPGVLVVTIQNRGTRDADEVPVQVENEAGRKVIDRIPLVRGQGIGVGAIRISSLGTRSGTLIVTINPADAPNAYPEANRQDNVVTFHFPE
ncbi:MAG: hypothetical protein JXA93_06035 [Anaerolineae bacterium]|nr:hypothetical protein [Anaerolineae bacterium]